MNSILNEKSVTAAKQNPVSKQNSMEFEPVILVLE